LVRARRAYYGEAMKPKAVAPAARKLPKNYQFVLDIVSRQGLGVHATMSEIFAIAARLHPGVGYSTIYRALNRLRELGLVAEVALPGHSSTVFEPAAPAHSHLVCTQCGTITDIDYVVRPSVLRKLAGDRKIEISDASLTLRGLCSVCSKEKRA
jgi:Fe2+ or Zn2+ uptake regulation protein